MSTATTEPKKTGEPKVKKASFAHKLYTGEVEYEFVGNRKRWYIISGVLLTISILALAILRLNLGIEFKGGADFTVPVSVSAGTPDQMRSAVEALNLPDNDDIQVISVGDNQVRVQTRSLSVDEVTQVKQALVGAGRADKSQVAFMVARFLGLGAAPKWAADTSDALGVAVCHLNMRRMLKLTGQH